MTGITPNDPTSDRAMRGQEPDGPRFAETSGHRRRNVTAAVVALAVVALAVVVVASTRGSRHSEAPP